MDTFTGKCQFIVTKITTAEKLLEAWCKEKKTPKVDPLKYLLEAILACGPEIAYSSIRKIEPVLNQYIEYVSLDSKKVLSSTTKTRSVSLFSKRKESHSSSDTIGKVNEVQISFLTKTAIIKAFMCMLRCQYGDAVKQFSTLLNNVKEEETYSQLNLLKFYCQANESNLTKKNLELILLNLQKSEYGGSLRQQILATVHEKLYRMTSKSNANSKSKSNKFNSLFKGSSTMKSHLKSAIECYISGIMSSSDDDLFIPQLYDKILSILIHNNTDIRVITFFYQLRYYFTLKADYTYLHIPGLLDDFVPDNTENNHRLLHDIHQIIEHKDVSNSCKKVDIETVEEIGFVKFWVEEYQKQKELSQPLIIFHSYLFA
ncbi:predicted protein [Candida tropicalis MYA-3404]|uniref:Uncharacterized protein n=1 Tax=Candida tropicalis (strain ATCC MYA-3404 / T1) TaxID=294747 RepID=C5M852_CANTT|nr:predicted protein [Candida tropicalis MYA-3404]EER33756.1 predicted protein [Candida tropicalis MYA-3404]KAG4407604.1 hypothetical protein JTP64_003139 [Candida tropicalis]